MIKKIFLLFCLVSQLTLIGQTVPTKRTLRFIGISGDFANLQMAVKSGEPVNVSIVPKNISPVYSCPDTGAVQLFRMVDGVDERGQPKKIKKIMAEVPIPQGKDQFLIVLGTAPDSSARVPLFGVPFADSYKEYPAETVRFINLTKERLAVKFEGQANEIPLGGMTSFPFPSSFRMCLMKIAHNNSGSWELAVDSSLGIKKKMRAVVLITPNPNPSNGTGPFWLDIIKERVPDEVK
jgi:hypothetical protein